MIASPSACAGTVQAVAATPRRTGQLECLFERVEGELDAVAVRLWGHSDVGTERPREGLADTFRGRRAGPGAPHVQRDAVIAPSSRPAAARARSSVWRTDQPLAAASRASRRRASWSGAMSSARPWPSDSEPSSSSISARSGRSSRRSEVRHRDTRAADTSADLVTGEPELLDQRCAGARLLERVEVLARHVLDQRELERGRVVVRADHRRDASPARRSAPHASGARRRSARRSRRAAGAPAPAAARRAP